ncbi:MAG: helix-turn-helix domain-containing protein [Bacteroides sp.]|nr:helix-turn-helix domain-containing protein [Bacteroides sp.]
MRQFSHYISLLLFILVASLYSAMDLHAAGGSEAYAKRIKELIKECSKLSKQFNYIEIEKPAYELLDLGKKAHSEIAEYYGNLYLGQVYLVRNDGQKSLPYFKRALSLAERNQDEPVICALYNCLGVYEASVNVNPYLAQYYFLKSQELAKKSKNKRQEIVLNVNLAELAINRKDPGGLIYALQGYEGGIKNDMPEIRNNSAVQLAILYHLQGNNDESLKYYDMALELCEKDDTKLLGQLYKLRSELYLDSKNYTEAKNFALLAIKYLTDNLVTELPSAYLQLAKVEYAQCNYALAEDALRLAIDASNSSSSRIHMPEIYTLLANVCNARENTTMAFDYMQKAKESSDSINQIAQQQMQMQRDIMLENADKEMTVATTQLSIKYLKRVIIIMAVSMLVLAILIFVLIRNYKRIQKLYDSIVIKNQRLMKAEDRLSKLTPTVEEVSEAAVKIENEISDSSIAFGSDSGKESSNLSEKNENIFREACRIMREERLYADSTFTREQLVERLGTNRTYLAQAIQQHTGRNYTQWINSWRIKEAMRILSDKTKLDYPLKQLSIDLGFGTIATFYKCFQAETGITPSNYRKSMKHLSEEGVNS